MEFKGRLGKNCLEEKVEIVKKKKGGKLKFILFAIIALIIFKFAVSTGEDGETSARIPVYEQFNMTEEEFAEVNNIFDKCGFSRITKVEKEDTLKDGTTLYYVEMEGVEPNKIIAKGKTEGNIIYVELTKDNKVSEISVNFNPVYKNGKVLNKVVAFTRLTVEEKTNCQLICESALKQILKSPSTAKFCSYSEYRWSKDDGIIKAQGFVDSQNGFGAMLRTNYVLTYNCVTQKAVSINIDGNVYKF